MTDAPKKQLGNLAEQAAQDFLLAKGMQLIMQNYRCLRGEIDLIMQDKQDVVFVEVRSRRSSHYGSPVESVTKNKQRKIIHAATYFLQQKKWLNHVNYRFDVVGISQNKLEWIKNAFSTDFF